MSKRFSILNSQFSIMFTLVLTSGLTLLLLTLLARDVWRLHIIPQLRPGVVPATGPLVSLLIPARDEAARIARCLEGALSQTYPCYEVIVVDDGSSDATPEILAHYAAIHERLRIIQGAPLPPGWMGKCHACQQAAGAAGGAWLLFLDADTAPQPGL